MAAKYCSQCGTKLPEEAKFCNECGKPVGKRPDTKSHHVVDQQWETCEIVCEKESPNGCLDLFFVSKRFPPAKFVAKAIGPNGLYTAGTVSGFYSDFADQNTNTEMDPSEDSSAKQALEKLVNELVQDGWQPTGAKGFRWFNHRFRRRINKT